LTALDGWHREEDASPSCLTAGRVLGLQQRGLIDFRATVAQFCVSIDCIIDGAKSKNLIKSTGE
jgi:hypothetical protein